MFHRDVAVVWVDELIVIEFRGIPYDLKSTYDNMKRIVLEGEKGLLFSWYRDLITFIHIHIDWKYNDIG